MQDLIDRIYEAAFVPDLWSDVLDRLSGLTRSLGGAVLLASDRHPPLFAATDSIRQSLIDFSSSEKWRGNTRPRRWLMAQGTFQRDLDCIAPEDLESDPMRIALIEYGLGWQMGTVLPMPSGEVVVYSLERRLADGPHEADTIDAANVFRPHLARAGLIAARLGLERASATVAALEALGLPALVMSAANRVLTANRLIEDMASVFVPLAHGGLALADADANGLMTEALRSVRAGGEPLVRSIPVSQKPDRGALVVHVVPLRRSAHDIFSGADVLIVATPLSATNMVPSPTILSGLFDLSPAESRLAAALAGGSTLKQAAADSRVSLNTTRSHLRNIFGKTGTHQQGELIALLKSMHLVPPDPA